MSRRAVLLSELSTLILWKLYHVHETFRPSSHNFSLHVQPFEEAAFLAFSQPKLGLPEEAASRKQAKELSIAVRCVSLVGESCSACACGSRALARLP